MPSVIPHQTDATSFLAIPTAGALQVLVREAWQATAPSPQAEESPEPLETEDEDQVPPSGDLFPVPPD